MDYVADDEDYTPMSKSLQSDDASAVKTIKIAQERPMFMKTSVRGRPVLVDSDRYEYRLEKFLAKSRDNKAYWACRWDQKYDCYARIITVGSEDDLKIVGKRNVHKCTLPW